MTIQQLEYIVALNRHRHFVHAAEECGISQPTLSAMIQKLEDELDVKIFDRNRHPIVPTSIGERIIAQAQTTINEMQRVRELVLSETDSLSGILTIGIIPTIAPYIVPEFIDRFKAAHDKVTLKITEMHNELIEAKLSSGAIDMAITVAGATNHLFLDIPLYNERFIAYMSPTCSYKNTKLRATAMPEENMWVLQEGLCLIRGLSFGFCNSPTANHNYEAGSIDTLVRIVDRIGGYTVIPEMHIQFLTSEQKKNVREITSPTMSRKVQLIIRQDYIKERMLNAVAETIKQIIPKKMIDERLQKFAIKL